MSRSTIPKHVRFKISYLDYYKDVLRRVSFCSKLFKKEYDKAKKFISLKDQNDLDNWIQNGQLS